MAESKSAALPLGYAPSVAPGASARDGTRGRTIVGPPSAINVCDSGEVAHGAPWYTRQKDFDLAVLTEFKEP